MKKSPFESILKVKQLNCSYGRRFSLKNIDLDVKVKDFIGIIGPNGSGKTTLLKTLTRYMQSDSGVILFNDSKIESYKPKELAREMATVVQAVNLDLALRVEDFVLLGRTPYRSRWQLSESENDFQIARKAMELTGSIQFCDRFLNTLSGGEKQLVLIARALTQEPSLLLLDEPTNHLDIAHQVNILNFLRRLNRDQELTIIIVLHDLNLAGEYCDRLILLKDGEVFRAGTPDEVLTFQNIEEVFETPVVVRENPLSQKPYVFLISEEVMTKK